MKHSGPGEVRIIGGQWKRSKLNVPLLPGLRPTPHRVRETVFNWLGQDLRGWRVLDAFAGTGVLGLESASRGAAHVTLIEREPKLVHAMRQTAQRLGASQVAVLHDDAMAWMREARSHFDVVFLDPPFADNLFANALSLAARCTAPTGWLYMESNRPLSSDEVPGGWRIHREGRAGVVQFRLLRQAPPLHSLRVDFNA